MIRQIHFVSGKGGVGKSFWSLCLAQKSAQLGHDTLLAELGERSYFKDLLRTATPDMEPITIAPNLGLSLWSGAKSLKEYILYLIKVPALYNLFFENPAVRSLISIAPALSELAIMGKITSGPRKHGPAMKQEILVVDAPAMGHFAALLRAPRGMAETIRFGPMGEQSRSIEKTFRDSKLCTFWLVTLPEELPVQETEELYLMLQKEFQIKARVVLNKTIQTKVDLNKKSDHPFDVFLQDQVTRQNTLRKRLLKLDPDLVEVPLGFSDKPWLKNDMVPSQVFS